jgi:hypothetical protein
VRPHCQPRLLQVCIKLASASGQRGLAAPRASGRAMPAAAPASLLCADQVREDWLWTAYTSVLWPLSARPPHLLQCLSSCAHMHESAQMLNGLGPRRVTYKRY